MTTSNRTRNSLPSAWKRHIREIFKEEKSQQHGHRARKHSSVQNRSFAFRSLPKACAAESAEVMPIFRRISSLKSTRRNGFDFISSPSTVGTVGSPRSRFCRTTAARACRSRLFGSTLRANLALLVVYSCALHLRSRQKGQLM